MSRIVVALRKESVDRNKVQLRGSLRKVVALRKESVDRNLCHPGLGYIGSVALRKESVDRNCATSPQSDMDSGSLSARRAWIEIS